MASPRPDRRDRLTAEGWSLLGLTGALGLAAWLGGNNVLMMLVGGLIALWVLDGVLGAWNLRHLQIRRILPAEPFAGQRAPGAFRLVNRRSWLPTADVAVRDSGGGAQARVARLPAGEEVQVPTAWHFDRRGEATLSTVNLDSRFPFGLVHRTRRLAHPEVLLVYPAPRGHGPAVRPGSAGADGIAAAGRGAVGDVDGLRAYRPGDPTRHIHWVTSARREAPVVLLRTDEQSDRVTVRVRDLAGRAWEHELSRAAGEILRAFRRGCRVGLELPDASLKARSGPAWRRTLLEALARQPERHP